MEATFRSERERRDGMLAAYYALLDGHRPFSEALATLALEVTKRLGYPPRHDAVGLGRSSGDHWPPAIDDLLQAFAERWALPMDVGTLDVWDSLGDGRAPPTRPSDHRGAPGRSQGSFEEYVRTHPPGPIRARRRGNRTAVREYHLRIGDRPYSGVGLTSAELEALEPDDMEPDGWEPAKPELRESARESQPEAGSWSDLLVYDPTGIVGDVTRRAGVRRGRRVGPAGRDLTAMMGATEARLRAQGFQRPGPRRRPEDIELGARYLFKRAVLRMRFSVIADAEPGTNEKVDEGVVRKTASRWAEELQIQLPRRGRPRS